VDEQHNASRREFLKQAGTVAWATPLIMTLTAGPASAQVSCAPTGQVCGFWSTPLSACIPDPSLAVCCSDCNTRGTGIQDQNCFCG
jgi:hypothetical protein